MTERVCCRCGAVGHRLNACKWPAKLTAAQQRVVDLIRAQPDGIRLVDLADLLGRAPPSVHAMLCRIDRDAARVTVVGRTHTARWCDADRADEIRERLQAAPPRPVERPATAYASLRVDEPRRPRRAVGEWTAPPVLGARWVFDLAAMAAA